MESIKESATAFVAPNKFHRDKKDHLEKVHQLRGFTSATFIYFAIVVADSCFKMPLWVTAIVKVAPILILMKFVVSQTGNSNGLTSCRFRHSIFLGLNFSLLGDLLLVYQNLSNIYFISGLISFAFGHVMYIRAFGWNPFGVKLFACFTALVIGFYAFLWHGGLYNQPRTIQIGAAVYATIIATMNWRTWARLSHQDFVDGRWYEFLGCIGAFFFLLSDSALSINKFVEQFPYSDYVIMCTYYLGQLGIALSVVDGPDRYIDDKKTM